MLWNGSLRKFIVRAGFLAKLPKGKIQLRDLDARLGGSYPFYYRFKPIRTMMVDASAATGPVSGSITNVLPEKDNAEDGGYASGGWKRRLQ